MEKYQNDWTGLDALIIGSGIMGTCIAYELSRQGYKTLNVDRLGDAGHGSTSASSAAIRFNYSTLEGTALAREGWFAWRNWQAHLQAPFRDDLARFTQCGCLVIRAQDDPLFDRVIDHADALQIPYEFWDEKLLSHHFPQSNLNCFAPAKRMDDAGFLHPTGGLVEEALYFPDAGYVNDPALAAKNVMQAAQRYGAKFRFNCQVGDILKSDDRQINGVILNTGEVIHTPIVVNAAGPASSKINRLAGLHNEMKITTRAQKKEVVYLDQVPAFAGNKVPLFSDNDIGCYMRPVGNNAILSGSQEPDCDTPVWVDDPDDFDQNFTDQWQTQVLRLAQRFPELGIPGQAKGVVGLYDVSDDWLPIYDCTSIKGYYLCCGTSGNQFKTAPVIGGIMANLISHCQNGHDHDRNPLDVLLPNTGQKINLGCYSRYRNVNIASSHTVLG